MDRKFQLVGLLGEGGFGTVFRARHRDLDKEVALKVLNPASTSDPERLRKRFLREVENMQRLVHKHVIQVREFGRDEALGCLYYTMDLVRGHDLARIIAQGPLDTARAVRLMVQALDALGEAHALGIVHRDLKPANLMVQMGPQGEEVRVLDFGIATAATDAGEELLGLTREGVAVGTLYYMSPEQARGQDLDGRSDLYALGTILYEALAERLPLEASADTADAQQGYWYKLIAETPPPLRDVAPWVPQAVADVVERALAKEPEERFPDAPAMRAALERALEASAEDSPSAPASSPEASTVIPPYAAEDAQRTPVPVGLLREHLMAAHQASRARSLAVVLPAHRFRGLGTQVRAIFDPGAFPHQLVVRYTAYDPEQPFAPFLQALDLEWDGKQVSPRARRASSSAVLPGLGRLVGLGSMAWGLLTGRERRNEQTLPAADPEELAQVLAELLQGSPPSFLLLWDMDVVPAPILEWVERLLGEVLPAELLVVGLWRSSERDPPGWARSLELAEAPPAPASSGLERALAFLARAWGALPGALLRPGGPLEALPGVEGLTLGGLVRELAREELLTVSSGGERYLLAPAWCERILGAQGLEAELLDPLLAHLPDLAGRLEPVWSERVRELLRAHGRSELADAWQGAQHASSELRRARAAALRGHTREAGLAFLRAREVLERSGQAELAAAVRLETGAYLSAIGRPRRARETLEPNLDPELELPAELALRSRLEWALALNRSDQRAHGRALQTFNQVHQDPAFAECPPETRLAAFLFRGHHHALAADLRAGRRDLYAALELVRAHPELTPYVGQVHNVLARLELEACRTEEAARHAQRALALSERHHDPYMKGAALMHLALAAEQVWDFPRAARALQANIEHNLRPGGRAPALAAGKYLLLADLYRCAGHLDEARRTLEWLEALLPELPEERRIKLWADRMMMEGLIRLDESPDPRGAGEAFRLARESYHEAEEAPHLWLVRGLARYHRRCGKLAKARAYLEQLARREVSTYERTLNLVEQGKLAREAGELEEAERCLRKAEGLAHVLGNARLGANLGELRGLLAGALRGKG